VERLFFCFVHLRDLDVRGVERHRERRGLVLQGEELRLAFHSFVMADALLAGNSALSMAASWLSRGWIWAFQHKAGGKMPPNSTLFNWNDDGLVKIANIQAPRWPRIAPGSPPKPKKAPFGAVPEVA
jgi:hypothetical protein